MWKLISVMELAELIREKKPMCLIDLREQEDYDAGHIPEAVCVSEKNLKEYLDKWFIEDEQKGDRDQRPEIVLICYRGPGSIQAARRLAKQGFVLAAVCGGMSAWEKLDKKMLRP